MTRLVSIDFETTGAVPGWENEPWQLGCVEIVDGEPVLEGNGWGWSDLQPRACIGQSVYGEVIMLLIEGRRPGISIGLSVGECADLMLKHKCMQALNVDGGTTAMIWYDGEYIMESSNPVMTQGRRIVREYDRRMAETGDFSLAAEANEKLCKMAREQTTDTLGKVLYESSMHMKNGFNRADN